MTKSTELRGLSNDDLQQQLKDGRTELFNLRFQQATSQLDNLARIVTVKKNIARVLTEIRSRELNIRVESASKVEEG
jgi:large subunit ribosomal protein L29